MTIIWVLALLVMLAPLGQGARLDPPSSQAHRDSTRGYTDAAAADLVTALPGLDGSPLFRLFGGYVTVDESAGRALFYTFVESARSPSTDPVVLWLNGGPGCSSIGGGFLSELGPFYPNKDGATLKTNAHSWNRVANVLFVESPAFVGFSYSKTAADAVVGDQRTAEDLHTFLERFFVRFPQFSGSAFYISGESYGGHYVPQLAQQIVRARKSGASSIHLRGFLVGNAWTDTAIDNAGAVDYWWSHALISDETAQGMHATCNFSHVGPLLAANEEAHAQQKNASATAEVDLPPRSGAHSLSSRRRTLSHCRWPLPPGTDAHHACNCFISKAEAERGGINIYDVYKDVCLSERSHRPAAQLSQLLQGHPAGQRLSVSLPNRRQSLATSGLGGAMPKPAVSAGGANRRESGQAQQVEASAYDPCIDDEVEVYLNRPDVQAALHANQTDPQPGPWQDCNGRVSYSYHDLLSSVLPVYKELLEEGLRILVFSGDVDGIVPVIGSRRWVAGLHLPVINPWRPWYSTTGQVGGYIVDYSKISFATVRNAGHMVPYVQPERAFFLFSHFLSLGSEAGSL